MAVKKIMVCMGQSNEDGAILATTLDAALRGPQANRYIFNYENNAIEVLDVDGVGLNLPNNNVNHIAGVANPLIRTAEQLLNVWSWGEVYIFVFALGGTPMGPSNSLRSWNVPDADLYTEFIIRWDAFIAALSALGHTADTQVVFWTQGESDAMVEGNDRAYYGLFREFKARVRAKLNIYVVTVPTPMWVTGVINGNIYSLYTYERVNNVRAALFKAGYDDPYYRVVDLNKYEQQLDILHLASAGVDAYAIDRAAILQTTTSNAMVLEEYTLQALRTGLLQEYGIDDTAANKAIIDDRINRAISWIVNRRKNWPWMERHHNIAVGEGAISMITPITEDRFGSALFTHNTSIATGYLATKGTGPASRELLTLDEESDTAGHVIQSVNASGITLPKPYRGDSNIALIVSIITGTSTFIVTSPTTMSSGIGIVTPKLSTTCVINILGANETINGAGPASLDGIKTATYFGTDGSGNMQWLLNINTTGSTYAVGGVCHVGLDVRIMQGVFELPEDYIRNTTMHVEDAINQETMFYRSPALFEREVRAEDISKSTNKIYTIIPDPLKLTSRSYLMTYPYFHGNDQIDLTYYGDARKLIADDDIPDVPRADRFAVWCAAAWFIAQWQKDTDLLMYYKDTALNELERMAKEYQLSDDITELLPSDAADVPGTIRGPEGFPEFDEP